MPNIPERLSLTMLGNKLGFALLPVTWKLMKPCPWLLEPPTLPQSNTSNRPLNRIKLRLKIHSIDSIPNIDHQYQSHNHTIQPKIQSHSKPNQTNNERERSKDVDDSKLSCRIETSNQLIERRSISSITRHRSPQHRCLFRSNSI